MYGAPYQGKILKPKVLGREFEGEPFFKRVSLNNRRNSLHNRHRIAEALSFMDEFFRDEVIIVHDFGVVIEDELFIDEHTGFLVIDIFIDF